MVQHQEGTRNLADRVAALEESVRILQHSLEKAPPLQKEHDYEYTSESSTESEECQMTAPRTYSLQKSAWDMAFVFGLPTFSRMTSFVIGLGVLLNIALQGSFCLVLTDDEWISMDSLKEEIKAATEWRLHHGHAIQSLDPVRGTSLVSRVCGGDLSLYTSEAKEELKDRVDTYFAKKGPLLSIVVISVFTMAVCKELRQVLSFVSGIRALPRAPTTIVTVGEDGVSRIECVSCSRVWVGICIALLRMGVALTLFYSGSIWLVKTVDIEDLILNCVGLSFVLEIDELVFESCSPSKLDHLVDNLQPLLLPRDASVLKHAVCLPARAAGLDSSCNRSGICLLLETTYEQSVQQSLRDIDEAMCSGNRDFVFGVDPMGGLLYMPTPAFGVPAQDKTLEAILQARESIVLRLVDFNMTADPNGVKMWPHAQPLGKSELMQRLDRHPIDVSNRKKVCEDGPLENYALGATGDEEVKNCTTAVKYCDEEQSLAIRMRCPHLCGCDNPDSGLYLRGVPDGCPTVCHESETYRRTLDNLTCADGTSEQLLRRPGWARWFASAAPFGDRKILPDLDCKGMLSFLAKERNNDGQYLPYYLCSVKGLTAFCPVTCGCTNQSKMQSFVKSGWGALHGCPTSCALKSLLPM